MSLPGYDDWKLAEPDEPELCEGCGEHPVPPGGRFCEYCVDYAKAEARGERV